MRNNPQKDDMERSTSRRHFLRSSGTGFTIAGVSKLDNKLQLDSQTNPSEDHVEVVKQTEREEVARVEIEGETTYVKHVHSGPEAGKIIFIDTPEGVSIQKAVEFSTTDGEEIKIQGGNQIEIVDRWDDFIRRHSSCPFFAYDNHLDVGISIEFDDNVNKYGKVAIGSAVCFIAAKAIPAIGEALQAAIGCSAIATWILDELVGDTDTVTIAEMDKSDVVDYYFGKVYSPKVVVGGGAGWKADRNDIIDIKPLSAGGLPFDVTAPRGLHLELFPGV